MTVSINNSVNAALDIQYAKAAERMLAKIDRLTNSQGADIQQALRELDVEVARLNESGDMLTKDNAYLQKVIRLLTTTFVSTARIIDTYSIDIEESGEIIAPVAVTAKVFSQLSGAARNPVSTDKLEWYIRELDKLGVDWNAPTSLDFARKYTESPVWKVRMAKWGEGYADLISDTVLKGIDSGWGPEYTAGKLRNLVQTMPKYAAENLTRTLQLTSYREASLAMEQINGGLIQYKIRLSALDETSCLSCIALHGTRLEKGERLDDHYRGYCSEYYVVPGGDEYPKMMQIGKSNRNRQFVPFQKGEDWFNSLSKERQAQQRSFVQSPAKFRAFQAGHPLSEFVGEHGDPLFGNMPIELSLKGALGESAKDFYSSNNKVVDITDVVTQDKSGIEILSSIQDYQKNNETEDMLFARNDYAADGYKLINSRLRENVQLGEDLEFIANQIDKGFENNPGIANNMTVYRGANIDATQLIPGATFTDNAYVSTSLSIDEIASFARKGNNTPVIMEILLPQGTKIYSPSVVGDIYAYEKEALLKRGSSFNVVERSTINDVYTYIKVEYVK